MTGKERVLRLEREYAGKWEERVGTKLAAMGISKDDYVQQASRHMIDLRPAGSNRVTADTKPCNPAGE
ncbi:hypothetical protein [Salinarimonas ramus]|uniref:Uncharacterized protein n=1 Tax=Salinarimonas ramus TaxID=690164 RepID=A0A917QH50_9HYPH|nr:hypothetical protein [Salinarimonas ramus]GGK50434.1 hypothetical protein GCM10011322_41860 [Salinarimonas ramus]